MEYIHEMILVRSKLQRKKLKKKLSGRNQAALSVLIWDKQSKHSLSTFLVILFFQTLLRSVHLMLVHE